MAKLKLAKYWAAGCGGCDVALLDINEAILDVAAVADILFWPIALDGKVADVQKLPDGAIDVTFFNGAVRNSENEKMAQLLRQKSKLLVAFGSCATQGGIPGLANLFDAETILRYIYEQSPSTDNPGGIRPQTEVECPGGQLDLPEFYDTVRALDQVVEVDYYLPGCPPAVPRIVEVIQAIVQGVLPLKGSVVGAFEKSVCDECERKKEEKTISGFKRVSLAEIDPEKCLLEQGFVCLGSATRGGCGTRCIKSGVACRGCYGPLPEVSEQGARVLSAVASIIAASDTESIANLLAQIPDPMGTFYRFGLAKSLLEHVCRPSPSAREVATVAET